MEEVEELLEEQRKEVNDAHRANLMWFIRNQKYLVHLYRGYFLAIRDCQMVGMFKDKMEAWEWACGKFHDGKTSIQHCIPGKQAYTIASH